MTNDELWEKAARLERVAIGWENDARLYRGERRWWREVRAERCRFLSNNAMLDACS